VACQLWGQLEKTACPPGRFSIPSGGERGFHVLMGHWTFGIAMHLYHALFCIQVTKE